MPPVNHPSSQKLEVPSPQEESQGNYNLIASLEDAITEFEDSSSLSSLRRALQTMQPRIKPYFSSSQPHKLIQEHAKGLASRFQSVVQSQSDNQTTPNPPTSTIRATSATSASSATNTASESRRSLSRGADYLNFTDMMDDDDDDEDLDENEANDEDDDDEEEILEETRMMDETLQTIQNASTNETTLKDLFSLGSNLELVYRDSLWEGMSPQIERLIVEHLFREGLVEEATLLQKETKIEADDTMKNNFNDMLDIGKSLQRGETKPSLEWCRGEIEHLEGEISKIELKIKNPDYSPKDEYAGIMKKLNGYHSLKESISNLSFRLHRICYIQLLKEYGKSDDISIVVQYAREHFGPLSRLPQYTDEIRTLMGALLYTNQPDFSLDSILQSMNIESEEDEWERLSDLFQDVACLKLGKPARSPLEITALAGQIALPILLRQANLLKTTMEAEEWEKLQNADQLTVRIPLGKDFHFRNIFTCPVSHEMATSDNPPVRLPCGHVLCKNSVNRITPSRGTNRIKCPYCRSVEFPKTKCQELNFG